MNRGVFFSKLAVFLLTSVFSNLVLAEQLVTTDSDATIINKTELIKIDVKLGDGELAAVGHEVKVHYTGWLYSEKAIDHHGKKFSTSYSLPVKPLKFSLGSGSVIKGWDLGVEGMKVGGKRTLIVPSEMAYGEKGGGEVIPPNAILIFDIELLEVQ